MSLRILLAFFCGVFLFSLSLEAQKLEAKVLIEKSIKYHDPENKLFEDRVVMNFIETRPGGEDRKSSIAFQIPQEQFQTQKISDDGKIISAIYKDSVSFTIEGSSTYTDEQAKKYRFDRKRLNTMKNYYQYLWLLPMKLNDPGTIIDPEVKKVDFFGQDLLQVRVSYTDEVGKDIWYFYFHPTTSALSGYRFYHDESKNDGEYILLEGDVNINGVRLPKSRTWYMHKDDKLLGTDILESLEF